MTRGCQNWPQLMTTYCIWGHFWNLVHANHFRGTSCNIIKPKEIDSHGWSRLKNVPCKSCLHLISSIFICVPQITYFTCQNIHTKKAFGILKYSNNWKKKFHWLSWVCGYYWENWFGSSGSCFKLQFTHHRSFFLIWCVFTTHGASQLLHRDLKVFCKMDLISNWFSSFFCLLLWVNPWKMKTVPTFPQTVRMHNVWAER